MDLAYEGARAASWLVEYAVSHGLVVEGDRVWAYNRLLESVGLYGPSCPACPEGEYDIDLALWALAEVAVKNGLVEDTAGGRDRAAMRVAGCIVPPPSVVGGRFWSLHDDEGPRAATDWFYGLCCDVNYVRRSAIARDLKWTVDTRWGELEITINKSKPEKDPRDIAAAGAAPVGEAYPACQLCVQNEGYSGRPAAASHGAHPARQNLRIVPIDLGGEQWGFQYSPYAYFNEHCIFMSSEHRPMHVDRGSIANLLRIVDVLPHYFVGSNADLPIVGGSILSHDHFQGGRHEFPMDRAREQDEFRMPGSAEVSCSVLEWPMTALRLRSDDKAALLEAAVRVIDLWRGWDAPRVGVFSCDEDGTRHNTVTPICRRRGSAFELDLVLRCNVTTEEHPLGVFHPHEDKWHVKKENIGLIEVMGLAILPPRLETELDAGRLTRDEIGRVFASVLEDAGVFKWDEAGRAELARFMAVLH